MTKFYAGFSFPNGSGLASHIHSFFPFLVSFHHCPHLSCSASSCLHPLNFLPTLLLPPFPSSFVLCFLRSFFLSFFLLRHHTLPFPPSLGMRGNLERCRLMTVETCVGHSGLVSGNTPGIQTRTSDILFLSLYVLMSHLLLSCFKSDESGTDASKSPIFLVKLKLLRLTRLHKVCASSHTFHCYPTDTKIECSALSSLKYSYIFYRWLLHRSLSAGSLRLPTPSISTVYKKA